MDDSTRWIALSAAVRAAHIAACMALAALWMFYARAPSPCTQGEGRRESAFVCWLTRRTWWLLVVIAASGAAWFALACIQITDLPPTQALAPRIMLKVLTHTQFGSMMEFRAALLSLCAACLLFFRPRMLLGIVSLTLLVSLAWMGHGQIGKHRALHLGNDALHLALCALWPAGLWPMLAFLRCEAMSDATLRVLRRFSATSLFAVIALAVTGVGNALFTIQMWSDLFDSIYGITLLIKIGLFLSLIALGALHRLRWLPMLARSPDLRRIRQTIVVEIVVAILILLAVGVLGTVAPPYMPGM